MKKMGKGMKKGGHSGGMKGRGVSSGKKQHNRSRGSCGLKHVGGGGKNRMP